MVPHHSGCGLFASTGTQDHSQASSSLHRGPMMVSEGQLNLNLGSGIPHSWDHTVYTGPTCYTTTIAFMNCKALNKLQGFSV